MGLPSRQAARHKVGQSPRPAAARDRSPVPVRAFLRGGRKLPRDRPSWRLRADPLLRHRPRAHSAQFCVRLSAELLTRQLATTDRQARQPRRVLSLVRVARPLLPLPFLRPRRQPVNCLGCLDWPQLASASASMPVLRWGWPPQVAMLWLWPRWRCRRFKGWPRPLRTALRLLADSASRRMVEVRVLHRIGPRRSCPRVQRKRWLRPAAFVLLRRWRNSAAQSANGSISAPCQARAPLTPFLSSRSPLHSRVGLACQARPVAQWLRRRRSKLVLAVVRRPLPRRPQLPLSCAPGRRHIRRSRLVVVFPRRRP